MNIKVIKKLIPEEICEDGGASVIIVGKETVDLETSIDEAKDVLIVVGDKLLVKGIERDGNARQLGDFITLYPVPTGEVIGEIIVGENVDFNGFGLAMGEGDTLRWSVPGTEKSGTVESAKIDSSWTRLTVTGDALEELASAEYNGKMIAFVLKVGNATVSKSATLKVA